MNCHRCQDRLYEYLDGSLSGAGNAAVERHLANCARCRLTVEDERQLAGQLTGQLRQSAGHLAVGRDLRQNILAAVRREATPPGAVETWLILWRRFLLGWGSAIALTIVVVALAFHFSSPRTSQGLRGQAPGREGELRTQVLISQRVPVCQSFREGNRVVDRITYETVVADAWLPASVNQTSPPKPNNQAPL